MTATWWEPLDEGLRDERSRVQADLVEQAWRERGDEVVVDRDANGTAVSMYSPNRLLVRTEDAPQVYDALGLGRPGRPTSRLAGLTVVDLSDDPRSLDEILDFLDGSLRVGIGTPDHVLHVSKTWCAPIEPAPPTGGDTGAGGSAAFVPAGFNTDPDSDGRDRLVAVVDTGLLDDVVAEHGWLAGVTGEPEPATVGHYRDHGTFIAGVVRTYAPQAAVEVQAVLTVGGTVYESDMVNGLFDSMNLELVERRPDVISFSGGTCTRRDRPLKSFEVFYDEVLKPLEGATVLVAAAGNDGSADRFWPAAFRWAVGVGALDAQGSSRVGFSNFGPWVEVFAHGTDIVNAYPNGIYTYTEPPIGTPTADFTDGLAVWSGTSFATPMVAGLIAARMSLRGGTPRESAEALIQFAQGNPGPDGSPRLTSAVDARQS